MRFRVHFIIVIFQFFCLFGHNVLYGQLSNSSKSQFFDAKYKMVKHSIVHEADSVFTLHKDLPVRILSVNGDSIFIEFKQDPDINFSEINSFQKTLLQPKEKMYFLMSEGVDKMKFTDFDISPLVIPLKIRPATSLNPLQFSGDVSIGPYFGYQRGSKTFDTQSVATQTTITFCLFGSPSLVNLNPSNQSDGTNNSNNLLGFSAGGGILFDVNNYQFGLVTGLDWISGTASQTWNYQGKTWYSFSFAYNLTNQ